MSSEEEHKAELKEKLAQEHYSKPFDELDAHEKRSVGGYMTGVLRKEHEGGEQHDTAAHGHNTRAHSDPEDAEAHKQGRREAIAREVCHKDYEKLDAHEKRVVAGHMAAETRKAHE